MFWSHWHRHITSNLVKKHFSREGKLNFDEVSHCQGLFLLNCWPSGVHVISEVLVITPSMGRVLHCFLLHCHCKETVYVWLQSWYINIIFKMISFMYFFYWLNLQMMIWEKYTTGIEKEGQSFDVPVSHTFSWLLVALL